MSREVSRKHEQKETRKLVETAASVCDICGSAPIEMHCKIICRNCGFTRDCTDP